MKKAFSLVELLVVIGIIGILGGIVIGTFSGGTSSARAARCLTNMRNLASGCQSYAMAKGAYPLAGSVEKLVVDASSGKRNITETYHELPGWVSWNSQGAYRSSPTASRASAGWNLSMYETDLDSRLYCLTNGALWKYVSGNHEVYLCPHHVKTKKALNPNWSYVMNGYFGCTCNFGQEIFDEAYGGIEYGAMSRSDRRLLFAEIPFAGIGVEAKETTSAGFDCDCTLQYKGMSTSSGQSETIGFNHKTGKLTFANVCFADGHCEKLIYPKEGLNEGELQDLTEWLCRGIDVSFDGKKYQNLTSDN